MPTFQARPLVAQIIKLEGADPHYAVAKRGSIILVPASLFEQFFEPMSELPKSRTGRKARKPRNSAAPSTPAPAPVVAVRKPSSVALRCLQLIEQHGPLTTAELSGHVYPDISSRLRVQNFSALSLALRRKGWVEKKTEPESKLDKWFLTKAGKEQLS